MTGPILIPKFMASRLSANAIFRCAGPVSRPIRAMLGGRNDSLTNAQTPVIARMPEKLVTKGKMKRIRPLRNSESLRRNKLPRRSDKRPAIGATMIAAIP